MESGPFAGQKDRFPIARQGFCAALLKLVRLATEEKAGHHYHIQLSRVDSKGRATLVAAYYHRGLESDD